MNNQTVRIKNLLQETYDDGTPVYYEYRDGDKIVRKTAKEFKEIMTDCGLKFEIYGYEGILNHIALLADEAAKTYYSKSRNGLAADAEDMFGTIYTALKERGYYGDK